MVKKIHPDAKTEHSSMEKFVELDECFKLLMQKFAKSRRNIEINEEEEIKVYDIKHTAPQHRMYLSNEGYGAGTVFQREKQYQQIRAMKAQQNVLEHRLQKAVASDNALIKKGGDHFKRHAIKTKYGFDRLVEDLILDAINRGDFNNLKGQGKPLEDKQSQNPYVDFVTHKINNILLDNGFTPEFITLNKEIREEILAIKKELKAERCYFSDESSEKEIEKWKQVVEKFQLNVKELNKKIDKYNLICPILNKQKTHVNLNRMADDIFKEKPEKYIPEMNTKQSRNSSIDNNSNENGFLGMLSNLLK
jgi:DnaJ family protein C protein 28